MKFKKLLSFILVFSLIMSSLPSTMLTGTDLLYSGTTKKGFEWSIDTENTLTITGSGSMDNFTSASPAPWTEHASSITSLILSEGVSTVGNYAFSSMKQLSSVSLPSTLTSINGNAFAGCSALEQLAFPETLENIYASAFTNCGLTSLYIPEKLENIGSNAFFGCSKMISIDVNENNAIYSSENGVLFNKDKTVLVFYPAAKSDTEYTLPSSVNTVATNAFYSNALESITLPEGLMTLEIGSFRASSRLTSITLPSTIESIASLSFAYSPLLAEAKFFSKPPVSMQDNAFTGTASGFMIKYFTSEHGWVEYATTLDKHPIDTAISGTTALGISWRIDSAGILTLTGIGATDSYSPDTPAPWSLSKEYFDTVIISEGITEVGAHLFADCNNLRSVSLPTTLEKISDHAFDSCGLTSVTLPGGLSYIGAFAFADTEISSIELPTSIDTLTPGAFASCIYLSSISVADENTVYAEKDGILYNKAFDTVILCPALSESVTLADSVKHIGAYAFHSFRASSIQLNEGIETIGDSAFASSSLTSVTLPRSIGGIGNSAFADSVYLAYAYFYGDALASLGAYAFANTADGFVIKYNKNAVGWSQEGYFGYPTEEVDNGNVGGDETFSWYFDLDSVLHISSAGAAIPDFTSESPAPWSAKADMITDIVLYDGISGIGAYSFFGCTSLEKINIPSSVAYIGIGAFGHCGKLYEVSVSEGNTHYTISDNALMSADKTTLVRFIGGELTEYTVPDAVTSISAYAFSNCALTKVTLPRSVESIGDCAFKNSSSLSTVLFEGDAISELADSVFEGCSEAFVINFYRHQNGWTEPEWNGYTSLGIEFSASDTSWSIVGTNLTVDIFGMLEGTYPWCDYADEITSVTIGASVSGISADILALLTSVREYTVYAENESLVSIDGVIYSIDKKTLIAYPAARSGTYIVPDGTNIIGSSAFINASVTAVTLPDTITVISDKAFYSSALTSVDLPLFINTIGDLAFAGSSELISAHFTGIKPEVIEEKIFDGTSESFTVFVLDYADVWSESEWPLSIEHTSISHGVCGTDMRYIITDDGRLIIYGSGDMHSFTYSTTPFKPFFEQITEVYMQSGITSVSSFGLCGLRNVSSVTLPDTVTAVGDRAFFNCSSLTVLNLGDSLEKIGKYAFDGCDELTSLTLPNVFKKLDRASFSGCNSLACIDIDNDTYKSVDGVVYTADMSELVLYPAAHGETYTIADGVRSIGEKAFVDSSIASITFPEGFERIEANAFDNCYALESFTLLDQISYIGDSAFTDCMSLESITFTGKRPEIHDNAFSDTLSDFALLYTEGRDGWDELEYGQAQAKPLYKLISSGLCGNELTYLLWDNGILEISGFGDMYDFTETTAWRQCADKILTIDLKADITSIGSYAFSGCSSLTSFDPGDISTLGSFAFSGCTVLESLILPETLIEIGAGAFIGCEKLTSFDFVNGTEHFKADGTLLYSADGTALIASLPITSGILKIDKTVSVISPHAFRETKLEKIIITHEPVIGEDAFTDCTATVYCYEGSTHAYMLENNVSFKLPQTFKDDASGAIAYILNPEEADIEFKAILYAGEMLKYSDTEIFKVYMLKFTVNSEEYTPVYGATVKLPMSSSDAKAYKLESNGEYTALDAEMVDCGGEAVSSCKLRFDVESSCDIRISVSGDVNCDGIINNADILSLKSYLNFGTLIDTVAADVNCDGIINGADCNAIAAVMAGL